MANSNSNATKKTQAQVYAEMREIFVELGKADLVEFVDKKVEQLAKKNGNSKLTEKQVENVSIKAEILGYLATVDKPVTISEIMENLSNSELTNQRVSALLTQLGEKGTKEVSKTYDKKKAYFSLV